MYEFWRENENFLYYCFINCLNFYQKPNQYAEFRSMAAIST